MKDREYNNKRPHQNTSFGFLSEKSMVRLRERINYMAYIATSKSLRKSISLPVTNYKLILITLTLSSAQIHSDRYIKKKLLEPFLRILRSQHKVKNYIWKAESQDNGNIHFHITIDKFIQWQKVRSHWNTIQETEGYVSRGKTEDPNSTDIHAVYKCKNIGGYLTKYISKGDLYKKSNNYEIWSNHYYKELNQITGCDMESKLEVSIKRPIEGKIYDCNKELKLIKPIYEEIPMLNEEIYNLRNSGAKSIDAMLYKLTFVESWNKVDLRGLKFILDASIRIAYGAPDQEFHK